MKPSYFRLLFALYICICAQGALGQSGRVKRNTDGTVNLESEMPPDAEKLKLGDSAPDFSLKGVDGKMYSLGNFSAPVLMVAFLSNHCPYSHAAETRLVPLAKEFQGKGLDVVAINPNSVEGVAITELGYSKYDDSFEDMIKYAKEKGFPFPGLRPI